MPLACHIGFRFWVWGWENRGGHGSWIFLCPQGRRTPGSPPGLILLPLSTGSVLCELGPKACAFYIPSKGGVLGSKISLATEPRAEPIRSGHRVVELLIGGWMGQAMVVGGAKVPPSHRPRASLQCTACGRSGGPGACAPAAAGGGPGAGCGPACPPSTAARPARVPSCRLSSAVWPPARVSSARGLLGRRCPAGWGGGETQGRQSGPVPCP